MIELRHVDKHYPGLRGEAGYHALRDVSLRIGEGDYAAIIGPSGSGKSTLMHILGCLDTPSSGEYLLDGENVAVLDGDALCAVRREKIGFVFQGCQLLPRLTALENVAVPLMLRGMDEKQREIVAMEALAQVGLAEHADHLPGRMSGGQRQRVAIARALSYRPRLLLADEPTGALDESSRDDVMAIFEGLHRTGRTLVLITHDRAVALRADRRFEVIGGDVRPV